MSEVKQRLLETTYAILEAEGPAALTTRRVCEQAGVTLPTLYHHFGNRDGLLAAVHAFALERFIAYKRGLRETADPVADLRTGGERIVEFAAAHRNVAIAVMSRAIEEPSLLDVGRALLRRRVERVEQAERLAVSVDEAVDAIWAVIQGLALLTLVPESQARDHRRVQAIVLDTLFARLCRAKPERS
ncbi:TetR/AcrR family transcriptional regulator [Nannocystaceae bacterium ST9]